MLISNNGASFTYGEKKIWWNIKKPQNITKMIIVTHKTSMIEYRELYENFSYAVCLNIFKLNAFFL